MTKTELTKRQLLSTFLHFNTNFIAREQMLAFMVTKEPDERVICKLLKESASESLHIAQEQIKALK